MVPLKRRQRVFSLCSSFSLFPNCSHLPVIYIAVMGGKSELSLGNDLHAGRSGTPLLPSLRGSGSQKPFASWQKDDTGKIKAV